MADRGMDAALTAVFSFLLSPSFHKYDNVFIHSGLSAEGALFVVV
jgi:hypothetical protein